MQGPRKASHAPTEVSRRAVLGAAVAGAAGLLVGRIAGAGHSSWSPDAAPTTSPPAAARPGYPFFGVHQAGVTTPAQDHLYFAAFDMVDGADRRDLVRVLRNWSDTAARLTQGMLNRSPDGTADPESPPEDTGEAVGLPTGGLTVTIGFGPGLFERDGVDRFGIAAARPPEFERLPLFVHDALDPTRSDGDLCLQVCADDPQVALHAVRNLARVGSGRTWLRWSQLGFVGTSRATAAQQTPRNLMGFKDGTNNIRGDDEAMLGEHVWLPPGSAPGWLTGGTYLVVRKIEMLIEEWDQEPLASQQGVFGRTKDRGGPLSGGDEFTAPVFDANISGAHAIDPVAHVRLAHPSNNGGIRILRRGYNYVDGTDAQGRFEAGLLFIAYQRSPEQFITIQRALATDLLNEYIRHVGSAIFVVPPGASDGGFVGETLFT